MPGKSAKLPANRVQTNSIAPIEHDTARGVSRGTIERDGFGNVFQSSGALSSDIIALPAPRKGPRPNARVYQSNQRIKLLLLDDNGRALDTLSFACKHRAAAEYLRAHIRAAGKQLDGLKLE